MTNEEKRALTEPKPKKVSNDRVVCHLRAVCHQTIKKSLQTELKGSKGRHESCLSNVATLL